MPHFGSRSSKGDLFVEYNVILPLEVSPETRRSKSFFLYHLFISPPLVGMLCSKLTLMFPSPSPHLELIEAFQPLSSTHDEL